jgi:hypothetical protein
LFKVAPAIKLKQLEKIFRSKVLTLLLSKGKITSDHINLLKSWRHSLRAVGLTGQRPAFRSFAAHASIPEKKKPWKTWPAISSGPLILKNE